MDRKLISFWGTPVSCLSEGRAETAKSLSPALCTAELLHAFSELQWTSSKTSHPYLFR